MKKILFALAIGALVIINTSCGSSENRKILGVWVPVAYSENGRWIDNPEDAAYYYFDAIEFQKDGSVVKWDFSKKKEKRADTAQYAYSNGVLMVDAKPLQVISGGNSDEIIISYQDQKLHNWTRTSSRASRHDIVVDVEQGVKLKKIAKNFNNNTYESIIKAYRPGAYAYPCGNGTINIFVSIDENDKWTASFRDSEVLLSGGINSDDELVFVTPENLQGRIFAVWSKGSVKLIDDDDRTWNCCKID